MVAPADLTGTPLSELRILSEECFALRGIVDDLQNLDQQYSSLNDGRELPPCPCP
jgi:hypothetical protein